jgi:hypothetical protein
VSGSAARTRVSIHVSVDETCTACGKQNEWSWNVLFSDGSREGRCPGHRTPEFDQYAIFTV